MPKSLRTITRMILIATLALTLLAPSGVLAGTAAELDRDGRAALQSLYASTPIAKEIGAKAKAVLVFPLVVKAGLLVGGQFGEGVLIKDGKTDGYYNTVEASYGLQAGGQTFGYALFFMTDEALAYLDSSAGWEIGVGPSVVVVEAGFAKSMTSTTLKDDIYAFFFDQAGLMAGLGLKGSKITEFTPDE